MSAANRMQLFWRCLARHVVLEATAVVLSRYKASQHTGVSTIKRLYASEWNATSRNPQRIRLISESSRDNGSQATISLLRGLNFHSDA